MRKKIYRKKRSVGPGLFLLFFFHASTVLSQSSFSGKVTGRDGLPLAGVTVRVNSIALTYSDSAGRFMFNAHLLDTLELTNVGYHAYKMILRQTGLLNIQMPESIVDLDEVLLVGYGKSRRGDLTGAVDRIGPSNFNKGTTANPMQQLQGKVAGLVITQPGGDPNGEFVVRLRGATSLEGQPPLVVIDGVAIDDFNKALAMINPGDIASFTVLKDASATAIYAARGANGVIIIKTKTAQSSAPFVQYEGSLNSEQPARRLPVLNAEQWRQATANIGGPNFDLGASTDWQKLITRTAFSHNHLIAFGGSSRQLNLRGSVGYIRQEGIVRNNNKDQITTRLSANERTLNDKLELTLSLNTSSISRIFLADQESTRQTTNGGSFLFNQSGNYLPVWPAYDSTGSYFIPSNNIVNPAFLVNEVYVRQREMYMQSSLKADYTIQKGFTAGVQLALSRSHENYDRFAPTIPGFGFPATASKATKEKQNYTGDIHANYKIGFGKQSLDLTTAYEYNSFTNQGFGVLASGFLIPQLVTNNLGAASSVLTSDISSFKTTVRLISFLGRAVYQYDNRYLLTTTLRRDGSSKFGPGNRWGLFPSFAFAWKASNEAFVKNISWISSLKFRVSYGLTGNQENLPVNSYQLLYGPADPYLYNGSFQQSYTVNQEYNPDLKWEVRKSVNLGLDLSLWNNRLNATLDIFRDKTSDMLYLYDLPQPPFLTSQVFANAANAVNKGLELTLATELITASKFTWMLSGNFATLTNRIVNLAGKFRGEDLQISNRHYGSAIGSGYSGAYISELKVGYPAGVFWIPQHVGFDGNGQEIFNNYDAKGVFVGTSTNYTDQDRVYIDPTPRFTYGLTNQLSWEKIDFSFFMRGVQGQKIFANSLMTLGSTLNLPAANVTTDALKDGFQYLPVPSTFWLRNGSFLRLENVSVSYEFNKIRKISLLRISATATNLLLFTRYKGVDPEVSTEGSQRYIDQYAYPKARGLLLGVSALF